MRGEHGAVVVVQVRGEGGNVESVESISVGGGWGTWVSHVGRGCSNLLRPWL